MHRPGIPAQRTGRHRASAPCSTAMVRPKATGRLSVVSPEMHPVQVHCSSMSVCKPQCHSRRHAVLARAGNKPTTTLFGSGISPQLFVEVSDQPLVLAKRSVINLREGVRDSELAHTSFTRVCNQPTLVVFYSSSLMGCLGQWLAHDYRDCAACTSC